MNENAKKGILVAVIVVALAIVAFAFVKVSSADQPTIVKTVTMPAGYKSEKQLADEAAQKGGSPGEAPAGERDLGGDVR